MRRRTRSSLLIVVLTAAALASPAGAQEREAPRDELQPPAKGEGAYLEDPSDPAPSGNTDSPRATYAASGTSIGAVAVERLRGATRYGTAVAVSAAGWPGGARAAVLARGDDWPEALAAAALAGALRGPLLLTPPDALLDGTAAELQRLGVEDVYAVGGLSAAVTQALQTAGYDVEQVRGADRYATAFAIAQRAVELGAKTDTVVIVSGETFADALSASAFAAGGPYPLLLTPPSGGEALLRERVEALGAAQAMVVGGRAAVPDDAVAGLPALERVSGSDRATTAAALGDHARGRGLAGPPVLVDASGFADGLTGGVLAGVARRAPLLVTTGVELAPAVPAFLARHADSAVTTVGGLDPLATCQLATGQSRAFLCAEQELASQGYHVAAVDGRVDGRTPWALYAFQKAAGLRVTGRFGEGEWQAMAARPVVAPRRPDLPPDHLEIDIGRQLVLLVRGGKVVHILHTSTGKASTPTVRGTFTVYEKRNFRQPWNAMYRPVFFFRGYALHGYPEIPLYAASHGCARLQDADMDLLFPQLQLGERVATY
jgi:putative cell wall-binding protein